MMAWKQHTFRLCLLFLFIAAAGKGLMELGRIIALEAQGPLDADSAIYFTIGRTMLNGFTLYKDFFDVQPPGIYLLTAASLLVTNDERLATGFVVFIITALPILFAWFALRESRSSNWYFRVVLTLFALTLGILLTLYLEERAPTVETQLFGSFFGILFVITVIRYPDRFDWKRSVLGSLLLLGSIGMKEPFLLTNLAAALLLARNKRHFFHAFLLPLMIGGILGSLMLLRMGILIPYVTTLDTTFFSRSVSSTRLFGPIILRPFATSMLFRNLSSMYVAGPFLVYPLWFLWSRAQAFRAGANVNLRRLSATAILVLAFGSGALLMDSLYHGILMPFAERNGIALADPFLLRHTVIKSVLAVILFVPSAHWLYRRTMLRWLALSLSALALTSLAVGSSVYSGNHFTFAVPVYAAVILLFLREAAQHGKLTPAFLVGGALTLLAIFSFSPNPDHLSYLFRHKERFTYAAQKEPIERVDQLMESCGWKQYYNEALQELAMAKHSPFGPLVTRYDYLSMQHPLHIKTAENITNNTQLIVATEQYEDPDPRPIDNLVVRRLRVLIPKSFTKEPPPCAAPFVPIDGVTLWFRKDPPAEGILMPQNAC